ncbi:unnamed protein product [Anisakis simplex]|uniref:Type II toxin-antitoxin system VapC family toxin n=1 Tax=Anisakis simplex TaxID=6269 RepID=A0A0M3JIX8_ANISI|nr:unnamed protein product [Anisakis simplex]
MLESNWNETTVSDADFWSAVGTLELRYAVPSLLQSYVTIDTKNVSRNALYIDQVSQVSHKLISVATV